MFATIVKCLKEAHAALFNTGRCEEEQQENLLVSKLLLEAAREAAKFEAILRSSERNLSEDKQDEALFHYTRFLSLYGKCTQDLTPNVISCSTSCWKLTGKETHDFTTAIMMKALTV